MASLAPRPGLAEFDRMDLETNGNLIEAWMWFVLSALLAGYTLLQPRALRRSLFFLGITMAVFGASDLVEARTGAWWEPWWLLLWKAACAGGLLLGFLRYFKLRKAISLSRPKGRGASSAP